MYVAILVTWRGRWEMGFAGDTLNEVKHNLMLHKKGPFLFVDSNIYDYYFIIKLNNIKLKSGIKNIFLSDKEDLLINKKIVYASYPFESMKGSALKEALDEIKMLAI